MKKFIVIVAALGAFAGMQSCRKTPTPTPDSGLQIDVTASIEGTTGAAAQGMERSAAQGMAQTRASKTAFATGDTLGLWVVPYSNSAGAGVRTELRAVDNYVDNVKHTYSEVTSKFTAATNVFYPNATAKVDLYGVMPYVGSMSAATNNSMTDPKAFLWKVKQLQTVADSVVLSDLMTSFVGGAKDGSNPALLFKHRLSQVLINFTVPEKYKEQIVTGVKKVEIVGVQLASTVNIADTAANPTLVALATNPKVDVSTFAFKKPTAPAIKGDYTYEGIVVPQSVLANTSVVRITLSVTGMGDVTFDCKSSAGYSYVQKKSTAINVNIESQTTILLDATNVTIQGWGATSAVSGSTVKMSRMLFDARKVSGAMNLAAVKSAKLTVDDSTYTAKVAYVVDAGDATKGVYTLEYDQRANWGGRLQKISFQDVDGADVMSEVIITDGGYQIKGDPTADSYATKIGTIVFETEGVHIYNATFAGFTDHKTAAANCHVVMPGSALQFNAKMKGNETVASLTPVSLRILWQTAESHGKYTGDNLTVGVNGNVAYNATTGIATVVAQKTGSAVVAAYSGANGTGNVLWSWHIWVPASAITNSDAVPTANEPGAGGAGKKFMDRNVGAVTATVGDVNAYGMFYQWGRKDPFTPSLGMPDGVSVGAVPIYNGKGVALDNPASGISKSTGFTFEANQADNLAASILNPMRHYDINDGAVKDNWTTNSASDQYWKAPVGSAQGYVDNRGAKGLYDPCPAGYRVPGNVSFRDFPTKTWTIWDKTEGQTWLGVWWPAAGSRTNNKGIVSSAGSSSLVWSSTPYSAVNVFDLYFNYSNLVITSNSNQRSSGISVRCVTE